MPLGPPALAWGAYPRVNGPQFWRVGASIGEVEVRRLAVEVPRLAIVGVCNLLCHVVLPNPNLLVGVKVSNLDDPCPP